MASFYRFSISYQPTQYNFSFGYTPDPLILDPITITAKINNDSVGTVSVAGGSTDVSDNIIVTEAAYSLYFTQGISMNMWLTDDLITPTESSHLYRVFMRANDSKNISLASNTRKWTISDSNTDFTSVILPPMATFKDQPFCFKYIDSVNNKAFSVVSGYQGYSNAPTSQLLTATDSNFNGIFDYKFDPTATSSNSNVGRNYFNSAFNLAAASFISNGSQWLTTGLYLNDSNITISKVSPPGTYVSDSNDSILFYDYSDSRDTRTIVLSDSMQYNFEKNIFIRNTSGDDFTFNIVAPDAFDFETSTHASGERSQLSIGCSNGKIVNLSLLSKYRAGGDLIQGSNRLYITGLYRGQGLTPLVDYPTTSIVNLTKCLNYVNSVDPNLIIQQTYPNSNYSRIFTVIATSNGDFSTISTYDDNSSNYFVFGGDNSVRTLSLDSNNWYTFASIYKDSTNTNLILPLSGWTL